MSLSAQRFKTRKGTLLARSSPRHPLTQRMVRGGLRALFWTHRWTGVALALLMTMWALSGIVMMYVAYPETTREERLAGLEPLDFPACCTGRPPALPPLDSASVEMLEGAPVLRWRAGEDSGILRLTDGRRLAPGPGDAAMIAASAINTLVPGNPCTAQVAPMTTARTTSTAAHAEMRLVRSAASSAAASDSSIR